ncbi:MAG: class III signal peptide-containing protein [Candidatus Diapherotrites archaeon]
MINEKKAQTSLEMLLLLGGVIIVVLIVAILVKNAVNQQTATGRNAINVAANQMS